MCFENALMLQDAIMSWCVMNHLPIPALAFAILLLRLFVYELENPVLFIIMQENGTYQQRVLVEYVREIETRARGLKEALQIAPPDA